jgi:hypothetical protein
MSNLSKLVRMTIVSLIIPISILLFSFIVYLMNYETLYTLVLVLVSLSTLYLIIFNFFDRFSKIEKLSKAPMFPEYDELKIYKVRNRFIDWFFWLSGEDNQYDRDIDDPPTHSTYAL